MLRFILKRLLAIIPVVLGVLLIVFSVMRMAPGDPAMAALGNRYTEEQYEAKKEELGLDRPFLVQFADYVVGVVTRFDLGTSYKSNRSVNTEIHERLPVTLRLGLTGIVITVVLGRSTWNIGGSETVFHRRLYCDSVISDHGVHAKLLAGLNADYHFCVAPPMAAGVHAIHCGGQRKILDPSCNHHWPAPCGIGTAVYPLDHAGCGSAGLHSYSTL